ncbi:phage head closure protein [Pseudomonas syringae]|uniref:phage head closure protein n=1 Tax=Pseudomonas syringae TaxID=317 RepID=UPI00101184E9|nr:phage head closure protein [Pseudomonas syringae]MBI6558126.1 phage head closure protein [Pseudomonas syringae]MBI6569165.1 phage head closure protein [Pseudomonas syringae]MBI6585166.1 phage head closure protein [Pseudomonas syringae]MBI6595722.1 phage head closure protein [Pseudomonas syringae]MDC6494322.1 phage head closure protein [Pseudomonas syringae]
MRAGRLRHRITFQALGRLQDDKTGEELASWQTVWDKVPAAIEPLSARDFIAAQAGQSEATARVVIRYRAGVLPTMRILYRGDTYDIKGPPLPDPDSGLDYLTILVAKGVNDG